MIASLRSLTVWFALAGASFVMAVSCGGSDKSSKSTAHTDTDNAGDGDGDGGVAGDGDGDGDGDNPVDIPDFQTDVNGDSTLAELSDADVAQLCSDVESYVDEQLSVDAVQPLVCNLMGVVAALEASGLTAGGGLPDNPPSDADLQQACSDAESACLEQTASAVQAQSGVGLPTVQCGPVDATCDATVNDLSTCLTELGGLRQELEQTAPDCESLNLVTALSVAITLGGNSLDTPASCQTVQACGTPPDGGTMPPVDEDAGTPAPDAAADAG